MKTAIIETTKLLITDTYVYIANEIITDLKVENEQFAGAKFEGVLFENIIFIDCNIQASAFIKTKFIDCKFINCNFSFTKFISCNLVECMFENCNFCITNSLNSNFLTCTFHGTEWKNGAFRLNELVDCKLDENTFKHLHQDGGDNKTLSGIEAFPLYANPMMQLVA